MAHHEHDDFGGLHRDLAATGAAMNRRGLLRLAAGFGAGLGAIQLLGCGGSNPTAPTTNTDTAAAPAATGSSACSTIPRETAGPFPADGSNGPTVLGASGVVPERHPTEFRRSQRNRRRRTAHDRAHHRVGLDVLAARRPRGVPVALRQARAVFPVFAGSHRPELLARRAGGRRQWPGHVHVDLSGVLLGPLAAHPFRGVPESRGRHQRGQQDCDLADRVAQGRPATWSMRRPVMPRASRTSRGCRWPATTSSATARRWSSRR